MLQAEHYRGLDWIPFGGLRKCVKCKKYQTLDAFRIRSKLNKKPNPTGLDYLCRKCKGTKNLHQHRLPGVPWTNTEKSRACKYGEAYRLGPMGRTCQLCGSPAESVDHNHSTGEVRGWLCQRCNVCVGWIESDYHRLEQLLAYLELSVTDSTGT